MTDSPLWGVLFIRSMMKMKETRDQFKKGPLEQSGNTAQVQRDRSQTDEFSTEKPECSLR